MSGSGVAEVARRFAAVQHGVVARRQLTESGISPNTIDGRISAPYLFPVFRGVYAVGRSQIGQDGLRMAAVLSAGPAAVFAHRSAASVFGLLPAERTVEVLRPRSGPAQRVPVDLDGARVWATLRIRTCRHMLDSDLTRIRGIPTTRVERTLLDLSGSLQGRALGRLFVEADRRVLLSDEALVACAARDIRRKGMGEFRRLVADRNTPAEIRSVLEGLFHQTCRRWNLPTPEVNARVGEYEVDCLWRGRRLIVELDGYEFHRGREMFEKDAARSNALRADGWTVLRFTWRMVNNEPRVIADQVRRVLEGSDQLARGGTQA